MKNYFELSAEEKSALARGKRFVPDAFVKAEESTTTTSTTTLNP